jgi:hypothetical protein
MVQPPEIARPSVGEQPPRAPRSSMAQVLSDFRVANHLRTIIQAYTKH